MCHEVADLVIFKATSLQFGDGDSKMNIKFLLGLALVALTGCNEVYTYELACDGDCDAPSVMVYRNDAGGDEDYPYSFVMETVGPQPLELHALHFTYYESLGVTLSIPPEQDCSVLHDEVIQLVCSDFDLPPGEQVEFRFALEGDWRKVGLMKLFVLTADKQEAVLTDLGGRWVEWFSDE